MTESKLRAEAADQGITETGRYLVWLESQVIELRRHQDELIATNNLELEKRREAERKPPMFRALMLVAAVHGSVLGIFIGVCFWFMRR